MGKLKLLLLLGLFFTISKSSAQIYDGHYLPFGLGYSHQTVKDNSFSPVSYSGHLGSISTGYSAISISARLIYRMSYKVYEKRNWHFFAGLVNHNIWDYRDISSFSNNSFNFNGFFSAGINLSTQKNFELWNQNFGFQYTLAIPFVTYALRPGYIKPFLAEEIGSQDFYFWSDYFALDSKTELFWKINSNNLIRLTYQWEYSQLDELNKVQVAGHHLSLSTIFGF